MIFINMSPLLWDIIVISIMVFGFVTGIFLGARALIFISSGNLLAIGLMVAFKSLLIDNFKSMVSPWFNHLDSNFVPFKNLLTDNIGFLMYAVIWIGAFNILFWAIYIILYFTILKKHKIEHKGINGTVGAIINLIRMSVVGWLIIIIVGTNIFGNKTLSYGMIKNEIANTSATYKMFSSIDENIPFLNVNVKDINTIINLYQNDNVFNKTIDSLTLDTTYEQCLSTIKNLRLVVTLRADENLKIDEALKQMKETGNIDVNKLNITIILNDHLINNFLDIKFMSPIFNAFSHIIDSYPETANLFEESLKNVLRPPIDTSSSQYSDRYNILKPIMENFVQSIDDSEAKAKVLTTLETIYKPY